MDEPTRAFESACGRRFSAWTLYARAFSGSRSQADYLVQKAISDVRAARPGAKTEAQIHERVLASIRTDALRSASAAPGSVLDRLQESGADAASTAARRLRELPRGERRRIERLFLERPGWTLERLALREGTTPGQVAAAVERSLRRIRGSGPATAGDHVPLETLVAYVRGALSGDEAAGVLSHAAACPECGGRLSTLQLLRAASVASMQAPRLPRGFRRAALALLIVGGLGLGLELAREWMPNPWREHATEETVPRWFYTFLYRSDDARAASELARGLSLLVDGSYEEAIETLTPLRDDPEAATYLGIARYLNEDRSRGTLRLLRSGTSSSRSGRLARWYLASLLLARGDVDAATRELEELARVRDWFGRAAEALLDELDDAKKDRLEAD